MTGVRRRDELEATVLLTLARLAIRTVPFRWLERWLERPMCAPELRGAARRQARRDVRAAIWAASRRLPGRTVCFPRAVAAQAMLRRRGVGVVVYYGAASVSPSGRLRAHVWVKDGRTPVIGVRASSGYPALASYPGTSQPSHRGGI